MCFGRGAGKTWLLRVLLHCLAMGKPDLKIGLLMPSLKQARAVFWYPHLLPDYYGELKGAIRGKPNLSELSVVYTNGSRLSTWGFENAGSIRGQRFDVIVQDETDDMSMELEASIVEPTMSRAGKNAIVVKAGTYTRGRYGILYRDMSLASAGEPGYFGLRITSEQSPQVDQDWLRSVKQRINPRTYDREYLVNPDSGEGLVYPHFVEVPREDGFTHVVEARQTTWSEVLVGCDWGFEHPGCYLVGGVIGSGRDAVVHCIEEVYASGYTEGWWIERAKEIRARYPYAHWYGGPDRPERIEALKHQAHVNIQPADNSVKEGIDTVADMMAICEDAQGRYTHLLVDPCCKGLIAEFGKYRRRKDVKRSAGGDPVFSDEIEKVSDDACDSLRYMLHSRFGKQQSRRFVRTGYQDAG